MQFNFTSEAIAENLPPDGRHSAQIADIRFSEGDATWMTVSLLLASGHTADYLVCVAAPKESRHAGKVPLGASAVKTMCAATGHDLGAMTSKESICSAFIGAAIDVQIAVKRKDGYPVAEVRRLLVPAEVLKPAPPAVEAEAAPAINRTRPRK
jgi:hypothetical protein